MALRRLEEIFDRILRPEHPFTMLLSYMEAGLDGGVFVNLAAGEPRSINLARPSDTQMRRYWDYCQGTSLPPGSLALKALVTVLRERAQKQKPLAERGRGDEGDN